MNRSWVRLYQGEDEWQFFVGKNGQGGLIRSPLVWRSIVDLVRESGLSDAAVREIVDKYLSLRVIISSPQGLAYWERIPTGLAV